jgi:hypothetical protein
MLKFLDDAPVPVWLFFLIYFSGSRDQRWLPSEASRPIKF